MSDREEKLVQQFRENGAIVCYSGEGTGAVKIGDAYYSVDFISAVLKNLNISAMVGQIGDIEKFVYGVLLASGVIPKKEIKK